MKSRLLITTAISTAFLAAACSTEADDPNGEWTATEDTKICTDSNGNRVTDDNCVVQNAQATGPNIMPGFFAWYYLSRGGVVPRVGSRVSGGSFQPAPGRSYRASSVSRGGFGSRASGYSRSGGVSS